MLTFVLAFVFASVLFYGSRSLREREHIYLTVSVLHGCLSFSFAAVPAGNAAAAARASRTNYQKK